MPPHSLGKSPPQGQADILLKELLSSMTRQPSPGIMKAWSLNYIPPKHLRLPEYTYEDAEESEEAQACELKASRGRQSLLQRKLLTDQMTKVLSAMSLSQMDEEEGEQTIDEPTALQDVAGDIESACVNHQTPRPELLLPCSLLAFNDRGNNGFNGPLNDTNVL